MKPLLLTLPLFLVSCATTPGDAGAAAPSKEDGGSAADVEKLERELELARMRLDLFHLKTKAIEEKHAAGLTEATAELDLARARLAQFEAFDLPTRKARADLDLRQARDRAQEAADELAQIELMYKDQDLDDMTAEFVVSRGRRNAERAAERIKIQERELASLLEQELPQEEQRLRLAVEKAQRALDDSNRAHELELGERKISLREKEQELAEIEEKLEQARADA